VIPMTDARADHTGRAVDVEIVTQATPAKAWEAWADPARLTEWFTDRATGFALPNQTLRWSNDRLKAETTYTVLSATPPTRLLLEGAGGPEASRLEVAISGTRDGTRVQLIHSGFPLTPDFDEHYTAVASGWRMSMAILRYYLEFQFGRSRQSFFVCRPMRYSTSRLAWLYRDPAGLQEWLAEAGSLGTPGGRVHLVLRGGRILRGDMLEDTGSEIAMGWDEINGVLELKSFPWDRENGMRAICLRGWGWELSADMAHEIEQELQAAVDRLESALEQAPASTTGLRV
jgi:uncharacterized protein YndB with AHSA1/START domain